jgi:hypothetical protein
MQKQLQVLYDDEFFAMLRRMHQIGGRQQKAAEQVRRLIGDVQIGIDPLHGLRRTKHGESRIEHCVKYDLNDFARLVTIQDQGVCQLLFVGTHEDSDKWLESHKGLKLGRGKDGRWECAVASPDVRKASGRIRREADYADEILIDRLDEANQHRFLEYIPVPLVRQVLQLRTGVPDDVIVRISAEISDDKKASLTFDVLAFLNAGDVEGAVTRLDLESGVLVPLEELSADEVLEVQDGATIKRIPIGSKDYQAWVDAFLKSDRSFGWFLFMHPEQERQVDMDHVGPAKLSGVSGSGKTCVAVKRAIRLARQSAEAQVCLITLNRSLATLIQRLVDCACLDTEVKRQIKVCSFFELCQELLLKFEPENARLYHDVAWKAGDHIDEVFREFYRLENNNNDASCLLPLHRSLAAQSIDPENYLREELDWIRSVVRPDRRETYLDIDRVGRKLSILPHRRKAILKGLDGWERKMSAVGVIDYLGLTSALYRHFDKLKPIFTSVIVDEAQDFGTTELSIIRQLVAEGPNDVFLCGDLAQQILPKCQNYGDAGINIIGRSHSIRKNYRNSREILKAAYAVLIENLDEAMIASGEMELLNPELANFSTPLPMVLSAESLDDEIMYARSIIAEAASENPNARACIAIAGYSFLEVSRFGKRHNIPVLDGTGDFLDAPCLLSDLEQTKGYEFDAMVIVNCAAGTLPPTHAPAEEAFRHGCRLYVAMTRARRHLYLSYSGQVSPWLEKAKEALAFDSWSDCVSPSESLRIGVPTRLPQFESHAATDLLSLSGRQFLYTPSAFGVSLEALEKIDELVDGKGLISGGQRVKWRTIGDMMTDINASPHARRLFGPKTSAEIIDAMARLNLG